MLHTRPKTARTRRRPGRTSAPGPAAARIHRFFSLPFPLPTPALPPPSFSFKHFPFLVKNFFGFIIRLFPGAWQRFQGAFASNDRKKLVKSAKSRERAAPRLLQCLFFPAAQNRQRPFNQSAPGTARSFSAVQAQAPPHAASIARAAVSPICGHTSVASRPGKTLPPPPGPAPARRLNRKPPIVFHHRIVHRVQLGEGQVDQQPRRGDRPVEQQAAHSQLRSAQEPGSQAQPSIRPLAHRKGAARSW